MEVFWPDGQILGRMQDFSDEVFGFSVQCGVYITEWLGGLCAYEA